MVRHAKRANPGIEVVARSHDEAERAALEAVGAARALVAEHELGRAMARAVLDAYTPVERGEAPGGAGDAGRPARGRHGGNGMKLGDMTFRQLATLLAAAAAIFGLSGAGLVLLLQTLSGGHVPPGGDGHAGERRRVEEAALRPDRARFRPIEGPLPATARRGITYVPIYSTVYLGRRETEVGLAVTLGVRNTSPDRELVVHHIDYYDTSGKLARHVVDRPHAVPAMATAEFFIDRDDPIGGPGANYLVEWSVPEGGGEPLIEAVLVGRSGPTSISLVGRGVLLGGTVAPASAGR